MSKTLAKKIKDALDVIKSINVEEVELGRYEVNDDFFYMVQEYESKTEDEMKWEAHKKYVDIQYIACGEEKVYIAPTSIMEVSEEYSEQRDVIFFKDIKQAATAVLTSNGYVVLYPEDAHKPGLAVDEPKIVKKIVGKVRI